MLMPRLLMSLAGSPPLVHPETNGDLIAWTTKKQSCVALSTAEAELIAISAATQDVRWAQQWLSRSSGYY